MEERSIRFLIGATYDVLPIPQNPKTPDPLCLLCSGTATLRHILYHILVRFVCHKAGIQVFRIRIRNEFIAKQVCTYKEFDLV